MQEPSGDDAKNSPALAGRARTILLAAVGLFIEKGFHQTSMRDIAGAAGVSLGNLYNHYSGKAALIESVAVLEREEQVEFLIALEQPGDPVEILLAFVDAYVAWAARSENVVLDAEITAEIYRNPESAAAFVDNRQRLETALGDVIRRIETDGAESPAARAALILDLLTISAQRAAFLPRRQSAEVKRSVRAAVSSLLGL